MIIMVRNMWYVLLFLIIFVYADDQYTIDGPLSAKYQPIWLANLTQWRAGIRQNISYNDDIYKQYLNWTTSMFVVPQSHIYDRYLYDQGSWTVDRFINDLARRYGGIDGVLLWGSYPNMGVDDRSQFQILAEDIPGGVEALAEICRQFHARGIRVGIPYNPWEVGTSRTNLSDDVLLANIASKINADFLFGDVMDFMPEQFFTSSLKAGNPLALQPENGPGLGGLQWTKMGWGYWNEDQFIPHVDLYKWIERKHMTQICSRWVKNHTTNLQEAFFNGIGFVSWENIWGIWNGINPRDAEAIKRIYSILRYFDKLLTSEQWEPHTLLYPQASNEGIFASKWPVEPGTVYSVEAIAWTIVNRNDANFTGPVIYVDCASYYNIDYYDAYYGKLIRVQQFSFNTCGLGLSIEANGYGAVLAINNKVNATEKKQISDFMAKQQALTKIPLSQFATYSPTLQQKMTDWGNVQMSQNNSQGMILIQEFKGWEFQVNGTEIEGVDGQAFEGVDVQFPWEAFAQRNHNPIKIDIEQFYIDMVPVTNGQYEKFLNDSKYVPSDGVNFLKDWRGLRSSPIGWENKPVTWVDLKDSMAYCNFYGKRLPNDWEWQYAAQGTDARKYPWGNEFDGDRIPIQSIQNDRPAPPNVGQHLNGSSPFGVLDMMGLVWQWTNEFTDDHTRAGLVRGSAYYRATGSHWYFPGDPSSQVNIKTHNKLLLMAPSYDRHGTVGFRCVSDTLIIQ